jgi:hypothetical protein
VVEERKATLAEIVRDEPPEVTEMRSLIGFVDGTVVEDPFSFLVAQHEAAHAVAAIVLGIRFEAVVVMSLFTPCSITRSSRRGSSASSRRPGRTDAVRYDQNCRARIRQRRRIAAFSGLRSR